MRNYLFLMGIICLAYNSEAQQVSTIFNSATQRIDDAIIFDNQGNLYGSHYQGSNVYRVSPSGQTTAFATGLNTPNGLALDSQGNLYVCDNIGNNIYKLDSTGGYIDTFSVINPSGIIKELDSDTMIFTRYAGHSIGKLAPDGTIIYTHSGGGLNGPVGLAYDDNGQLYVGNFGDRKIFKVHESSLTYVATVPGGSYLGFISYAQGALWGTTFNQHKIYRIEPNFIDSVTLYAGFSQGSVDGPIGQARFSQPNGIVASYTGDTIYISDYGTGNVRMITGIALSDYFIPMASFLSDVYPNPTTGLATFKIEQFYESLHVTLVNAIGQVVLSDLDVQGDTYSFDLSKVDSGVYFVIVTLDGKKEAIRVVKE